MGDPVGIASYAREHLNPDGTVLLVEPFALDDRVANLSGNPMAALLYTASSSICTPNSLSQEVGLGLGAQAGEVRLREVFEQAGFTHFRRAAETPLNLILEARICDHARSATSNSLPRGGGSAASDQRPPRQSATHTEARCRPRRACQSTLPEALTALITRTFEYPTTTANQRASDCPRPPVRWRREARG